MAYQKFDLVQETSTSTGTGAMALGGAVTRRRTFSAVMSNGDTCYVLIEHGSAAEWEICLATYNTSGNTLSRGTVAASSTGSAVSFSAGSKTITLVGPASTIVTMDPNGDATVTRFLMAIGLFAKNGAIGYSALQPGEVSNSGYFAHHRADGTRVGYIGWGDSNTHYVNEQSGSHLFYGGVTGVTLLATLNATGLGVGTWPISSSTSMGWFNGDVTLNSVNRAIMGNLYFSGGWKYTGNGNGAAIKWAPTTSIALQFLTAPNNVSGAGAAATPVELASFAPAGHFTPGVDNSQTLGSASFRWSVVYAGTGTINTSGREAKVGIREATDAEKRAARRIIDAGSKLYQLKDAVDAKGDSARIHVGYVAEDVRDALAAEGLDPWRYAFLCADPVIVTETYTEIVTREKRRLVDGATEPTIEMRDGRPTRVNKPVERWETVGTLVDVVGDDGQVVLVPAGVDAEGSPTFRPLQHFVSETEDVEQTLTREVPLIDGNGDPVMRLGLRYSELEAFLRCAVEG